MGNLISIAVIVLILLFYTVRNKEIREIQKRNRDENELVKVKSIATDGFCPIFSASRTDPGIKKY
jgi:hypothetical protein